MTLTVRLDETLAAALERYCNTTGATKSLVVQESLASYLLADQAKLAGKGRRGAAVPPPATVSDNYKAFEKAGLIGCVALGLEHGADNAAVRARVAESFAQRRARQGGV